MDSNSIEAAVRTEVETLHQFFVEWFSGQCPNNDQYFAREFKQRFDPEFLLIPPAGTALSLETLSQAVYARYGSNPDFRIAIRQVNVRRESDHYVLATYEEWQKHALASTPANNGRVATVVFHFDRKLTWFHVHETWLPRDIMDSEPYAF